MKIKFNPNDPLLKQAAKINEALKSAGFESYWVGGTVRDLILKRNIDNVDIATSAKPDEVISILKSSGYKFKEFGKKFGTVLAVAGGKIVEITTFRSEGFYSDKRHPDKVDFIKDYSKDALRRDFTINALYFDPKSGELLDPVQGLKDLNAKLLRFVGKANDRIDEDALRMLRAVRFATRLGFKMEKNSFAAIKTRAKYIQKISGERIKAELDKILLSTSRAQGLKLLQDLGLLKFLIPDFPKLKAIHHNTKKYHLEGDVFTHTLMVIDKLDFLDLIYAGLFHDLGKTKTLVKQAKDGEIVHHFFGHQKVSMEQFKEFAQRLKFPRQSQMLIEWLILHHDDRAGFKQAKLITQIKYVMQPNFELLLKVWEADTLSNYRLSETGKVVQKKSPAVILAEEILTKLKKLYPLIKKLASGDVIMRWAGIKPGPKVNKLRQEVIKDIYLGKIKSEADLKKTLSRQ